MTPIYTGIRRRLLKKAIFYHQFTMVTRRHHEVTINMEGFGPIETVTIFSSCLVRGDSPRAGRASCQQVVTKSHVHRFLQGTQNAGGQPTYSEGNMDQQRQVAAHTLKGTEAHPWAISVFTVDNTVTSSQHLEVSNQGQIHKPYLRRDTMAQSISEL
ncbi:hypothetical protein P152DRAFT_247050 [Eremomyces bilateralis CBS 781.70]|uniref:Uncharacterized protein n=1 Tax=Eremomyces bilateralis CBS 781.70 TaxID=1392243 RepID=A0A6G1GAP1_9PEZI|nr:uncharacterized protein P152DRAFT_247050 [Eremomyces bilateralis CBS 781.70]KAF1815135.1 hypothetical protein P152DRAFT_247050 [Eremomyces bilateralis CBS 781.70]